MKFIAGALAALAFGAASAQATIIDFETDAGGNPLAAPTLFFDATPLTTQYLPLNVTLTGAGAILNDTTFETGARSESNLLAYNSFAFFGSGTPVGFGDVFTFLNPVASFSFYAATNGGTEEFGVAVFDSGNMLVDAVVVDLANSYQLFSFDGGDIQTVAFGLVDEAGVFVVDDLTIGEGGPAIPLPGAAIFMAAGAAMVFRKRKALQS